MKTKGFKDLFELELKDLYSAEKQLTKALPKMAKAATNDDLQQAFESHLEETEGQIERLEKIFKQLDILYTRVEKCKAMEGLIEEGKEIMEEGLEPEVLDAALICAAQKVEHYEIAGYGCARTFARRLGHQEVAELLQETLDEEGSADKKLTEIAENVVNQEAESAGVGDEEEAQFSISIGACRRRNTGGVGRRRYRDCISRVEATPRLPTA
jgi:ferritin-like metal-binding protein YciE